MSDSFPRQQARTRRFTLGAPRSFTVADDGSRVLFLRSASGDDPTNRLWSFDVASGAARLLVDPAVVLAEGDDTDLPAAERARRERAREGAGGIVAFAVGGEDDRTISFALAGRPFVVDAASGEVNQADVNGAFDVRVDPSGRRVAYVSDRSLRVWSLDGGRADSGGSDIAATDVEVIAEQDEHVSWGSAEFVAGEEMGRTRGYWWAPDGEALLVSRVDVSGVSIWYLADPTEPGVEPRSMRYPAAGTDNADVQLAIVGLDGSRLDVDWSRGEFEYLADVSWTAENGLHLVVQTRDQRRLAVLRVDVASGATEVVREIADDVWVELVGGSPSWWDGALVTVEEHEGTRRLFVDGSPVSGDDLWVRRVVGSYLGGVVFTASSESTEVQVFRWTGAVVEQLTAEPGVHDAVVGGATMVVTSSLASSTRRRYEIRSGAAVHSVEDHSETPLITPSFELIRSGEQAVRTAVLFPTEDPGGPLPVLLDPYGGPHAQRVLAAASAHTTSQWFADQGYLVIVADGRGTPGRGTDWERAVYGDLATLILDDQLTALDEVDGRFPGRVDRTRVAMRGWSFGGYLAALAVLRRPDVFAAAIAGAPVTEWRLYDTHYTERYLGHPDTDPENYDRSSLLPSAAGLRRPLMLIHGLADDNVVAAHTLQLSRALMHAGRPHEVLPLAGVSHMTPQEEVAENLLRLQVEFLERSLRV